MVNRRNIALYIIFVIIGLVIFYGIRTDLKFFSHDIYNKNEKKIIWKPTPGDRFQWQFTGIFDTSIDADIYSLDLFDTSEEVIKELHKNNKKIICYVNVGAWEDWRSDANNFPKEVLGNDYSGWQGERWLDIRRLDLLSPLIRNRFELCKQKGFDGIEPDNLDVYEIGEEKSGFNITYEDQLAFNYWIAQEAHVLGLPIGLKNDSSQVKELLKEFDWAISESCYKFGWCDDFEAFINVNKAVAMIEYSDANISFNDACAYAVRNSFSMLYKNRNLDAWVKYCK